MLWNLVLLPSQNHNRVHVTCYHSFLRLCRHAFYLEYILLENIVFENVKYSWQTIHFYFFIKLCMFSSVAILVYLKKKSNCCFIMSYFQICSFITHRLQKWNSWWEFTATRIYLYRMHVIYFFNTNFCISFLWNLSEKFNEKMIESLCKTRKSDLIIKQCTYFNIA